MMNALSCYAKSYKENMYSNQYQERLAVMYRKIGGEKNGGIVIIIHNLDTKIGSKI